MSTSPPRDSKDRVKGIIAELEVIKQELDVTDSIEISEPARWQDYHSLVDDLTPATHTDFDKYRVKVNPAHKIMVSNGPIFLPDTVDTVVFRTNVGRLIARLRAYTGEPTHTVHTLDVEFHSEIKIKCSQLFDSGNYSEAVEKAFKVVRDKLRLLTSYETGSEAFGKGGIHIKGAVAPHVDRDFNEAVKFLLMSIDFFRNEKAHSSDARIDGPKRAGEYLSLCSLAMNLLDQAEIN